MNLYRITCDATGKSLITPEPSDVDEDEVLRKHTKEPVLCEPLYADYKKHGLNSFSVERIGQHASGVKTAKLERLNIKMLGDLSYTSEPLLTKLYNL